MNIIELFQQHVHETPDKTALRVRGGNLSYAQLSGETERLCILMVDMGVTEGDCLLVALDNQAEFVTTMLASAALGVMVAPVSTTLPTANIMNLLRAVDARFIVANHQVSRRLLEQSEGLGRYMLVAGPALDGCRNFAETTTLQGGFALSQCHVDPNANFLLTMTSGSTGEPKPITLTQAGKIRRSLDGARDLYGLSADDVIITATPMYHSLGFRLTLLPLLIGAESVILGNFTPQGWVRAVHENRVSFAIIVASQLELILNELDARPAQLDSLHTLVSSSALLRPDVKARCIDLLDCAFHECYGASEVGIVTDLAPGADETHLGSVGQALAYVDIRIIDDAGKDLPSGGVGEIACRTKTAFEGYFRQPDATRASLHDDYFLTGDVGYLDDDGYLYLTGRKKDIIIVGGTNVYPEDVESVLRDAPGVRDCAVVGIPDEYFGEAALACVVASGEHPDVRKIRGYCMMRLADYQVPLAYEIVDELPRTALGKIRRQVLRDRYRGLDASADLRRLLARRVTA